MVRPLTQKLIDAVLMDEYPNSNAVIVDFGIDSQEHYEALYYPIRHEEITPEQLDEALGNGAKLTQLVKNAPSNPHKDIVFHCLWDDLEPEEPEETEDNLDDVQADAMTLASAGMGTDEDYGRFSDDEPF